MKIERFVSPPPITPYAPTWDFAISEGLLPINVEKLAKTCLEKEKEIKKLPVTRVKDGKGKEVVFDGYTGVGKNSTTSKSWLYNLFDWNTPETNALKGHVRMEVDDYNRALGNPIPQDLYVQCWYNVLRYGQKMNPHLHSTNDQAYLSAHFIVQCEDTSTVYMNPVNQLNDPYLIERKNEPGTLTIFPECVPHYTTKHRSFKPRITIAMDMRTIKPIHGPTHEVQNALLGEGTLL